MNAPLVTTGQICALARRLHERRVAFAEAMERTTERARARGVLVVAPFPERVGDDAIAAALDALDDLDGVPWPEPSKPSKAKRPRPHQPEQRARVEVYVRRAR